MTIELRIGGKATGISKVDHLGSLPANNLPTRFGEPVSHDLFGGFVLGGVAFACGVAAGVHFPDH